MKKTGPRLPTKIAKRLLPKVQMGNWAAFREFLDNPAKRHQIQKASEKYGVPVAKIEERLWHALTHHSTPTHAASSPASIAYVLAHQPKRKSPGGAQQRKVIVNSAALETIAAPSREAGIVRRESWQKILQTLKAQLTRKKNPALYIRVFVGFFLEGRSEERIAGTENISYARVWQIVRELKTKIRTTPRLKKAVEELYEK